MNLCIECTARAARAVGQRVELCVGCLGRARAAFPQPPSPGSWRVVDLKSISVSSGRAPGGPLLAGTARYQVTFDALDPERMEAIRTAVESFPLMDAILREVFREDLADFDAGLWHRRRERIGILIGQLDEARRGG